MDENSKNEKQEYDSTFKHLTFTQDSLSQWILKKIGKRYLSLEDLGDPKCKISPFPENALSVIVQSKLGGSWRGVSLLKDCMTLNLIHLVFQHLKPKTVIDLGSWTGASAMYFADQLDIIGVQGQRVISYDISHDYLHATAQADKRIEFVKGDLTEYKLLIPEEFLAKLEHPVFISDDVHVNTVELLSYINGYLKKGDFIMIEDLHPETMDKIDYETGQIKSQKETGHLTEHILFQFLEKNPQWRVDNYFASYFGQYSTTNGFGYLSRVE